MKRRDFLLITGCCSSLTLLSGCIDDITEFNSNPGEVKTDIIDQKEYSLKNFDNYSIEESIKISNNNQDLIIRSWFTTYTKETDNTIKSNTNTISSIYNIFTTPSANIANKELNPVFYEDISDLTKRLEDSLQDFEIEVHDKIEKYNLTNKNIEKTIKVEKFNATFKFMNYGMNIDSYIYRSQFKFDNDLILLLGGHINNVNEEDTINKMIENTYTKPIEDLNIYNNL